VSPLTTSAFDLSDHPAKNDPALIAADERHFAAVAETFEQSIADLEASRSLRIVGDRAEARHGFAESWPDRLARVGLDRVGLSTLRINYRTPEEVMAEAAPVIRAVLPDANVPTSIRSGGVPVVRGSASELAAVLGSWLAEHSDGVACVITVDEPAEDALPTDRRVRWLTPELVKGLEFDLVVLVDPDAFATGI
jgi:superfamily I DNA/RNA helicase